MIWIMIIMIVALALIGVPMSFSMLTGSVWFMLTSGMPQTLMIQRLIMAVGDSFSMLAIPFFMLAGTIMNAGGVRHVSLISATRWSATFPAVWATSTSFAA